MQLYPWYFMPLTEHKILYQREGETKYCILPIGHLSEETVEAQNKELRKFRDSHTRKISRIATY